MAFKWRLIIDGPGHPLWNMAVDEALFYYQGLPDAVPVLRFYTWDRPTLSLGLFQKAETVPSGALQALNIYPVRRITGGASVLHGTDLTYSVAARIEKPIPRGIVDSCQYLGRGIIEGLKILGVEAGFGREKSTRNRPASCFALFAPTDIICQGRKLVGSAQHRKGETLLQHGSIVMRDITRVLELLFDGPAMDIIALEQVIGRPSSERELISALQTGFSRALGIELENSELEKEEWTMAEHLVKAIKHRWPA